MRENRSAPAKFREIRTPRFLLRELTESDVSDRYVSWFSDGKAAQFIVAARQKQTLETLREYVREKRNSNQALMVGIFSRETSHHIGNMKFEPIHYAQRWSVMGVLIGDPEWRGKGVFHEVFNAVALFLTNERGLNDFWLGVEKVNEPAIRAYLKEGFEEDSPPHHIIPDPKSHVLYMRRRAEQP